MKITQRRTNATLRALPVRDLENEACRANDGGDFAYFGRIMDVLCERCGQVHHDGVLRTLASEQR